MHSDLPLLGMDRGQLPCPPVFLSWEQHCCTGCTSPCLLLACNSIVSSPLPPLRLSVLWLSITSFGSSLKTLITFCTKTFLLNSLQARPLSPLQLCWLLQPLQAQCWWLRPAPVSLLIWVPARHQRSGHPRASPAMQALTRASFAAHCHPTEGYISVFVVSLFPGQTVPSQDQHTTFVYHLREGGGQE